MGMNRVVFLLTNVFTSGQAHPPLAGAIEHLLRSTNMDLVSGS